MHHAHRLAIAPFGAAFEIVADDERVLAAAEEALARYPSDGGVARQLTLRVTTTAASNGASGWPTTSRTADGAVMELRCGDSVLRCNHESGAATLAATPATLACADELRMFVEAAFWSPTISTGAIHAVHSALVTRHGVGVMLRGASGAGKSTLSYTALQAGYGLASDDWIYAPAGFAPDTMWGYPWRMWMTTDAASRFTELRDRSAVPHPGSDRIKIAVEVPADRQVVRHVVHAVVMIRPGVSAGFEAVSADEATQMFEASALEAERESLPASFVQHLMNRPAFVLDRGESPQAAVTALDALVDSLR